MFKNEYNIDVRIEEKIKTFWYIKLVNNIQELY